MKQDDRESSSRDLEHQTGEVCSLKSSKPSRDRVVLKRQIGLWGCIALVVGAVIGSGIFISPKGILRNTGSVGLSLLVWVACGVLSTIGALCYAELGTMIPRSGGDFTYLLESFGAVPAFLRIYTLTIASRTGTCAILMITAATYLTGPFFGECTIPRVLIQLLGTTVLATVLCLNSVSVPWSNRVQIVFSIAKVLGLVIIIIAGFVLLIQGQGENFENAFTPVIDVPPERIPLAFYSGLFAYSGWQYLPCVTEEMINPSRNIPLGIIVSMTIITVVYMMVNVAYYVVISPVELLASNAVALTFGDRVLGSWSAVCSLAVALSCIGGVNGAIFATARSLMVSSQEGVTPEVLGMIHVHYKTPLPAALAFFPIVVCMLLFGDVGTILNYMSFPNWLFSCLSFAIIPYYRWKHPDMPRPFKVPIILPIIFIACGLFVLAVSLYSSPLDCGIGAAITVTGIPVYLLFVWWESKPSWFTNALDTLTSVLQRFLLIAPQDTKSD
ncbi:cystine/glutamate transporter-like [Acanthaster planci]|uniref:Cystine/glutamate transporter n=1 Tax=Acanthaster planci TaxID=133434 RepID=A0A8B7ZCN9_ACAPL|nr:cystine/glutamate transporter-like [Acanthaster planci]